MRWKVVNTMKRDFFFKNFRGRLILCELQRRCMDGWTASFKEAASERGKWIQSFHIRTFQARSGFQLKFDKTSNIVIKVIE